MNSAEQKKSSNSEPVLRWELLDAISICQKQLGLNKGDITALRAMLSFLQLKDKTGAETPARPDMLLICYASNQSICRRANDMDDSTLRRHIRRLIAVGLVSRHDSASGKRFPLKRSNQVTDAFGIDLRPAFIRAAQIISDAKEYQQIEEDRRNLRAEILAMRRRYKEYTVNSDTDTETWLDSLKTLLRRKSTSLTEVRQIWARLKSMTNGNAERQSPEPMKEVKLKISSEGSAKQSRSDGRHVQNKREIDRTGTLQQSTSKGRYEAKNIPSLSAAYNAGTCNEQSQMAMKQSDRTAVLPATAGQTARHIESCKLNQNKGVQLSLKREKGDNEGDDACTFGILKAKYPNCSEFIPDDCLSPERFTETIQLLPAAIGLQKCHPRVLMKEIGLWSMMEIFEYLIAKAPQIRNLQAYYERMLASCRSELRTG